MNEQEIIDISGRITKNGSPLDSKLYTWDSLTKTLATTEQNIKIDFSDIDNATITAWYNATITAGYNATITAGHNATITAWNNVTITAGHNATITAWYNATITAGHNATITAWNNVTITAGHYSVFHRKDVFEFFELKKDLTYFICPFEIPGYVVEGKYSITGQSAIISDGILSFIINKKTSKNGTIYKVKNHGSDKESYLLDIDGVYSHGDTIKKAKDSYIYKIKDRDTSEYETLELNSNITLETAVKMYRCITGACESGTKYFVDNLKSKPKNLTVQKVIEITKGQFNHNLLVDFFKKRRKP